MNSIDTNCAALNASLKSSFTFFYNDYQPFVESSSPSHDYFFSFISLSFHNPPGHFSGT